MDIKGLNHLAINTCDIEESIAFYRDILGFHLESIQAGNDIKTAFMLKDGVCKIEIIEKHDCAGETRRPEPTMVDHIAFDLDHVEAMEKELRSLGVTITEPFAELKEFNTRVLKIYDPSGICIALREDIE